MPSAAAPRWPAASPRSRTPRRSTPSAAPRPTPSSSTSRAGLFVAARRVADRRSTPHSRAGADALDVRLPDDDNVVVGGTLGADLDGDAAPDLTWAGTERLAFTGQTGDDDLEFGGDGADLGDPLDIPVTLSGGDGDDTLRGGSPPTRFAGGAGEDVVTYDDRTAARQRDAQRPARTTARRARATTSAPTSRISPAARATTR